MMDVVIFPRIVLAGVEFPVNLPNLPADLGRDVQLQSLPQQHVDLVMNACEPRGYNFQPIRPYSDLYTFVRMNPPDEHEWDSDRRLQECVAISRLVRPTSISFEYSARVTLTSEGGLHSVMPGPVGGFGATTWIVQTDHGDWLDANDVATLSDLWRQTNIAALPERLWRALWYFEYAARVPHVPVRWILLTTGVEALINTQADRPTRQFIVRFRALADRFAQMTISGTQASQIYALRSTISHGSGPNDLGDNLPLYSLLETVLRMAIKEGISRQDVQRLFSSVEAIEREWPI